MLEGVVASVGNIRMICPTRVISTGIQISLLFGKGSRVLYLFF
jgi:hypothetical protein